MQQLLGVLFQQDNARRQTRRAVTRLSPHCYCLSPDLSSIQHIWDHLGWRVGHPTSLNELEASLLQIWTEEVSQDIIQNLPPVTCVEAEVGRRSSSTRRLRGGCPGSPQPV
ncbi:transposable element Tcb2 transposase [Trichonephila clavipes]|nr:transposable element Tcb2 transposase [Trichonephila clavipes]